jgi:Fe-S-cluster containining protein
MGSVARYVRERLELRKVFAAYNGGADVPLEKLSSRTPCNGCTACCRGLNVALHVRESGEGLKYDTLPDGTRRLRRNPDGSCVHLVGGNCEVYATRPLTCRIFDCRDNAVTSCASPDQEQPLTEAIMRWRPEFKTFADRELFTRLHQEVLELHRREPGLHALELAANVVKSDLSRRLLER